MKFEDIFSHGSWSRHLLTSDCLDDWQQYCCRSTSSAEESLCMWYANTVSWADKCIWHKKERLCPDSQQWKRPLADSQQNWNKAWYSECLRQSVCLCWLSCETSNCCHYQNRWELNITELHWCSDTKMYMWSSPVLFGICQISCKWMLAGEAVIWTR